MPAPVIRLLLSALLVWHLLAMVGSMGRDLPVIGAFRTQVTKRYEQTIGVHQYWPMFTPNPPRNTHWLEATAVRGEVKGALPTLIDPPDPKGTVWLYQRENKFQRNALAKKRKFLRAALTRWFCGVAEEQGSPLTHVRFSVATVATPKPNQRAAAGPREHWPVLHKDLERWRCGP